MKMKKIGVDVKTQIAMAAALSMAASGAFADTATGVTAVERVAHSIAMSANYSPNVTVAGNKWGKLSTKAQGGDAKQWASHSEQAGYKWGSEIQNESSSERKASGAEAEWASTGGAVVQGYKWGVRNDANQAGYKWGVRNGADQAGYKWGVR